MRYWMRSVPVVALAMGALLAVTGCERSVEHAAPPAPLIAVMTVETHDLPVHGEFVGQTEGSRAVEVRAQVSGILVSSNYDQGGYVEKGQLLFEIEPETYKAALDQAEGVVAQVQARFTQAQQDLHRILNLYARNAVSQRDRDTAQATYDSVKADLASARAAAEDARIKLSYAYVTSPVSGYAGKENRSVGNLVNANSSSENLLTVVNQVNPIYVNYAVPSPKYMRMRTLLEQKRLVIDKNTYAKIHLADDSAYPIEGKVTFVDMAVNPSTSVVSARAEFANKDLFVLPGQFVRITLYGPKLINAILVPQQAIIQTQQGTMVVVVNQENKAEMRKIVLSDNLGDWFLLEEGLKSGDRIVIEGANKVVPGQPVQIDESKNTVTMPESARLLSAISFGSVA